MARRWARASWLAPTVATVGLGIFAAWAPAASVRADSTTTEPAPAERLPNVLLISLDTTRADFLTFKDAETSEHMTRLAREGTIFSQAISGSSWTLPGHAQMFTGMAPPYHGTESSDTSVDPLLPTLPEILDAQGYYTAGVFTVRYLWGDYGFGRGFDFYRSGMLDQDRAHAGPNEWLSNRGDEAEERSWLVNSRDYVSSENVVALVRMALETASADDPVFLFAHFFDPHNDYIPPPPWDKRFDPEYDGPIDGRDMLNNRNILDPLVWPYQRVDDRGLQHLRALYRGEIAWTDQAIGQLIDMLEDHRRLDDTLIIITSDHGEEFFEHGTLTHRVNLFDESIRVPLLVVLPKRWRSGIAHEVTEQVTLSDILPTIVDYLGVEQPPGVTGRSLRPAISGEDFASRPELISLYLSKYRQAGTRGHMQTYGLRTPEWKFTRAVILKPGEPMQVQGEFYDLVKDPEERHVLVDQSHPLVKEHWELLENELDRAREAWQTQDRSPRDDITTDLSEESAAELRALGYIEEGTGRDAVERRRPWGLQPMDPVALGSAEGSSPLWIGMAGLLLVAIVYLARRRRGSPGD